MFVCGDNDHARYPKKGTHYPHPNGDLDESADSLIFNL
tara:strand:- start:549 stop:662 length:114 start_codon:yes stop_codon:yes gene_type:complete